MQQSESRLIKGLKLLSKPAVFLMQKLSFGQKSLLLALLISIPLATISTFLYQQISQDIKTSQQELTGLKIFPPLVKLIQLLQQHRGASAGVLGGTSELSEQQILLQSQIIELFELQQHELPLTLLNSEDWQKIRSQWKLLVDQGLTGSIEGNFKSHTALIKSIQIVINTIADEYQLTAVHHLDSYYLIHTGLEELLPTLENLGQIRAYGTGILATRSSQEKQRIKLSILMARSRQSVEHLVLDLAKTGYYNPVIKTLLIGISQNIHDNTQSILKLASSNIIQGHYALTAVDFFNQLTKTINSNYDVFYSNILPLVTQLITQELNQSRKIVLISRVVLSTIIFILLYICLGIYLSAKKNIQTLAQASLAFSKGDFSTRIPTDACNELAIANESFNAMADQIVEFLRNKKKNSDRIRAIIDSAQDALIQMNACGEIIGWNKKAETMFGWMQSEVLGKRLEDYIIPLRYRKQHSQGLQHFLETGTAGAALNSLIEIEALHAKGYEFPIEITRSVVKFEGEYEFNAFIRDITVRKQIEEELQLFARIFTETHEGIIITDKNSLIVDVNPKFSKITGYDREEVMGKNPKFLNSDKQSPEFYTEVQQRINNEGHWQGELWNCRKDGSHYAELLNISVLTDDNNNITHYIGIFTDITESKQQQDQLKLLAHYDALTGLPNRVLFTDRFVQAIAHSKRARKKLAVCFLDLDDFKPVNDNYGHEAGDQLLIEVAKRITNNIREEDTVSRLGGDEFTFLLNEIDSIEQVKQTLERIHYALAQPYLIGDSPHKITASSGVTLYPDDQGDIDTLLRHADQAMYQAKLKGKHCYQLFNAAQDQETINKHSQLTEIKQALDHNEFSLYYQPKVNMVTGEVLGVEALIRWHHPKKGLIPPLDFIPLIEGTQLEIQIGHWVIKNALIQLRKWQKLEIQLQISVNIASQHLLSSAFINQLDMELKKYPEVDSGHLQLEILESSALSDLDAIRSTLKTCQEYLGLSVALDDFGTGYSSLTHLRSLSANTIKIDQSFVRDLLVDPDDYIIVNGVINMAHAFHLSVIAEGVETVEHGLMLMLMGCDHAQGYGIAKPMPAEEFPQWLKCYMPNKVWQQQGIQQYSRKEEKLELFKMKLKHWNEDIIRNIYSSAGSIDKWPIMNSKKCPCGRWIQLEEKDRHFKLEELKLLEKTHDSLHALANDLYLDCQKGNLQEAIDKLPTFQAAVAEINKAVKVMAD